MAILNAEVVDVLMWVGIAVGFVVAIAILGLFVAALGERRRVRRTTHLEDRRWLTPPPVICNNYL